MSRMIVQLIPEAQRGSLCCHSAGIEWTIDSNPDSTNFFKNEMIENVLLDKAARTVLITVKGEGFKFFQLQDDESLLVIQRWAHSHLKMETDSEAYASFKNPSLHRTDDAILTVFEAFAQIPRKFNDLFTSASTSSRPRRQERTIPPNPWITERPLDLKPTPVQPGLKLEIDVKELDYEKCSALVYNSAGSVLTNHGAYWQLWAETQAVQVNEIDYVAEECLIRIEKDLSRLGTSDPALIERTRALLLRAARCYPEIGYVQGMADLALPFARNNVDQAFLPFFEQFKDNFSTDSSSMKKQLQVLYENVRELSPVLADWLSFRRDCRALLFAYRWLLVCLRREVSADEADRLWSVMMAAERVKNISMQKYLLTFCTAMILSVKQKLLQECFRFEDVIKLFNEKSDPLVLLRLMPKDVEKDKEFGAFEKHTKGIGMKLLLKMGYKPGSGLGKDEEGRAEPVQIKLRPRGVGIGFSDGEEPEEDKEFEEKSKFEQKRAKTVNSIASQPKPSKPVQPALQVDEEFFKPASEPVQIIDMTSTTADSALLRLKRALLKAQQKLQNGIALNERLAEEARRSLARTHQEIEQQECKAEAIRAEIEKKRKLMALINELKTFNESNQEDWQELLQKSDGSESVFASVIVPSYKKLLTGEDSQLLLSVSSLCQASLPPQQALQLFYHCWWPAHRSAFSGFNVNDLAGWRACLAVLNDWKAILPRESFQLPYLTNQILIPRLHSLMTVSEGISDASGAFDVVSALQAYLLQNLTMPKEIYSQLIGQEIDRFTARIVRSLPLERCKDLEIPRQLLLQRIGHALSRQFIVDPAEQDISVLEQVFSFNLPASELSPLLAVHVAPKLLSALRKWLHSPQADFEEIAAWYEAWRGFFDEILQEDENGAFSEAFAQLLIEIDNFLK